MIVEYTESLTGESTSVALPRDRKDAFDLLEQINSHAKDPGKYRALVRLWTASDLYMLGLFSTAARRQTAWPDEHGYRRLEIDHDYQFNFARAIQQRCDGVIDTSPRGHWKSTWKTFLRSLYEVLREPSAKIGVFSFEKDAAARHVRRILDELTANDVLRFAWADRIPGDPGKEGCRWSSEAIDLLNPTGGSSVSPTFGAYTFTAGLPTGSRFSIAIYDDVENEKSVGNEKMTDKTIRHFLSSLNLLGESPRIWINGTYHSVRGLISYLVEHGWEERCFPAEIAGTEPDDLVWWFNHYGGTNPSTGEPLRPALKTVALHGRSAFLHPLDLAWHKWKDPVGYAQQYLGKRGRVGANVMPVECLQYYDGKPEDHAEGKNIYVTIDPSNGSVDPYVAMWWAIQPDGTIYLIDAQRRKLPPSQWYEKVTSATAKWDRIGRVFELRIEEFAQANYSPHLAEAFKEHRIHCEFVRCHDNRAKGAHGDASIDRPFLRLETPMRDCRFYLPRSLYIDGDAEPGMLPPKYDFISYMRDEEFTKWPHHSRDDVMACMALLFDASKEAAERPLVASPDPRTYSYKAAPPRNHTRSWMSAGLPGAR